MADIKLGLSGSEVTLPTGVHYNIPVKYYQQIGKAQMSDGSFRYGFYKKQRFWRLEWCVPLPLANIQTLIDLCDLNAILHFQNQWESDDWYDVIIPENGFSYWPVQVWGASGEKYLAVMELEEAI